ncbi:MAG: pentapeptide repeat-containing protein [Snowella sp.]|nr:pentapeptide repeat-containing protein [Snowella sp.]
MAQSPFSKNSQPPTSEIPTTETNAEQIETEPIVEQLSSSNLEEIKKQFYDLKRQQIHHHPFDLELNLIKIAKNLGISLDDCRRLWEYYSHSTRPLSRRKIFVEKSILGTLHKFGQAIVFLGQFSLLFGAILYIAEADKRQRESRNQAWQVINTIKPAEINASAGRIEALDSLNKGCSEENNPPPLLSKQVWQTWRKLPFIQGFYSECINLMGLNLQGAQLGSINLPWAQLQEANLNKANLEDANLQFSQLVSANLTQAKLTQSNLEGANLTNANLTNALLNSAKLRNANLFKADLSFADLTGADLRGANFVNAILYGAVVGRAIYDQKTQPFDNFKGFLQQNLAYFIDSKEKTQTNLQSANLKGVDLSETNLQEANLKGANLRDAKLRRSHLEGANLESANLRGADLSDTYLDEKTNFAHVIYDEITESTFPWRWQSLLTRSRAYKIKPKADLQKAYLGGADLQNADLSGANLTQANLEKADLRGTNLIGANLTQANLKAAIYDVTTKFPEAFQEQAKQQGYNLDFDANLQGAHLEALHLIDSMLVRSNLRDANLKNVNLNGSNLAEATLINANLQQAILKQVDLRQANLLNTNLIGANLQDSDLTGANLQNANLQGAILNNTDIGGVDFTQTWGLTVEQVKEAKNWKKARFSSPFQAQLNQED